jgi:hypothetical protein
MSFVKRIIGPDEQLIGVSAAHWIYGAKGIGWLVLFSLGGLIIRYFINSFVVAGTGILALTGFGQVAFWICLSIGSVLFFFHLLIMISTEVALTTKRVIYKRGLIAVDVREVDIEEVKAADVNNGWLGRFLNYGYLIFDARFVTNLQLPAIGDPYRFVKALNERRSKVKQDSMTIVLDGGQQVSVRNQNQQAQQGQERPQEQAQQGQRQVLQQPQKEDHVQSIHDPRYQSLSDNPFEEMRAALDELPYQPEGQTQREPERIPEQKQHRRQRLTKDATKAQARERRMSENRKRIKQMKPVLFEKVKLRHKVKDSFTMIANYGNKY